MADRHQNIFYNLIKNETSLTEVFCNLMSYKAFRDHFIEFVSELSEFEIPCDSVEYENFTTEEDFGFSQDDSQKNGRGDLILEFDDKKYIFEIKIEAYRDFTINQPDGYIRYLEENGQSKKDLYFILPKEHINKDKISSKIDSKNIFYWEDLLANIRKKGLTDIPYVEDFCNILDYRWFYSKTLDFSVYEIDIIKKGGVTMESKAIPKIMMELFEVVDTLNRQFKNKTNSNEYRDSIQYGFFIKNEKKEPILWFGIDYKFWEETGVPLSIAISKEDSAYFEKFEKHYRNEKLSEIQYDNVVFYHLPIEISEMIGTNDIKKKIIEVQQKIGLTTSGEE